MSIGNFNKKYTDRTSNCITVNVRSVYYNLFFAAPAVGAELAGGDSDRIQQVVEPVIAERREVKFMADSIHHSLVFGRRRVGVYTQTLIRNIVLALKLLDDTASDEIIIALRA